MAEYDTKSVLLAEMSKEGNKLCFDCGVPMPQWASLSFGIYVCLSCSGAHRGLGVHLSFIRSLTMDKWTPQQVEKMLKGGNAKCKAFFEASPEYDPSMSIADKYNCHFATQYRDKLTAEADGRTWQPSDTPAPAAAPSGALRKPRSTQSSRANSPQPPGRAGSMGAGSAIERNNSPLSPGAAGGVSNPYNQKARNEDYFATLGAANASRRDDLPPSQGGKYGGFGSGGPSNSFSPSNATSSKALPGLDDFRDDPVSALGKGWGFFGAALSQVSKSVTETVTPLAERGIDPALQSQLSGYYSKATSALASGAQIAGQGLAEGMRSGGGIIKQNMGYDVGDLGATYVDRVTGRGAGMGYAQVGNEAGYGNGYSVPSAETQEEGGADFFGEHLDSSNARSGLGGYKDTTPAPVVAPPVDADWSKLAPRAAAAKAAGGSSGRASPAASAAAAKKKNDDWDDFGTDDWK